MKQIEQAFESFLFNCRFLVIVAVVSSLLASVLMFLKGGLEVIKGAIVFVNTTFGAHLAVPGGEGHAVADLSVMMIAAVDSFLFATVLLIFSMGSYELFISAIDPASRREDSRPRWLAIHSLDDLKNALGKVILMILIVRLFEAVSQIEYTKPIDLLYMGLAIALVSLALFLAHHKGSASKGHASKGSGQETGA